MAKAVTVYQYEQPRCPEGWNESERRFYARIIETLDDIYSKYGRIDEKLLSSSFVTKVNNAPDVALEKLEDAYSSATVDDLMTKSLTANAARIVELTVEKMIADTVVAGQITAGTLESTFAYMVSLSAKFGSFDFETVQNLVSGAMVLEKGSADSLYIKNLSVLYAQILNATIGSLCIQASDGNYYQIDVTENLDGEAIVNATKVEVNEGEISAGQTESGKVILDTDILAERLTTGTLFATEALTNSLLAAKIDVDTLTARSAFIQKLTSSEAFIDRLVSNTAFIHELTTRKIIGEKSLEMIAGTADAAKGAAYAAKSAAGAAQSAADAAKSAADTAQSAAEAAQGTADGAMLATAHVGVNPPEAPIPAGRQWLDQGVEPWTLRSWIGADVRTEPEYAQTHSGNPVVLDEGRVLSLDSIRNSFGPVQAGSGDPSPDNIRPISGRTGVKLTHTDASYAAWRDIIEDINSGLAPTKYPVGTKLLINHGVYGKRLFDVVAHDYLKATDDSSKHTMTIQQHDLLPEIQFDAPEAFYYAEAELPAGTYNFTLATAYNSWAEGTYQFTLTKPVPKGGQLAISGYAYNAMTSLQVRSYANQTTTIATESVAITAGSGGTNLGTFGEGLNHSQRVSYSSNNYKESAMRQFLNSSAAAGSVWTPQTKFDRPPSWLTSLAGYKNGLDQDFLAVVGKVVLPCSANNTYEAPDISIIKGAKYTLNDEFYLASAMEIFNTNLDVADDSKVFPFYEGAGNADRIKYRDGSAAYWWLRTPRSGNAFAVRLVSSDGTVYDGSAHGADCLAPACTIYDTGTEPNGVVRVIGKDEEYADENDSSYAADFGQTVYGGTLDWATGVLTVDMGVKTLDGTESWYLDGSGYNYAYAPTGIDLLQGDGVELITSHYISAKNASELSGAQGQGKILQFNGNKWYINHDCQAMGLDAWKSYLSAQAAAGTPVQVCYRLAEPVVVQLNLPAVYPLDGTNVLYGDAGALEVDSTASGWRVVNDPAELQSAQEALVLQQARMDEALNRLGMAMVLDADGVHVHRPVTNPPCETLTADDSFNVLVNSAIAATFAASYQKMGGQIVVRQTSNGLIFGG